jgi:SecD/SecF fusion protein
MGKPKKWQVFLIATVFFLTVYNILPTIIFYSKPLKSFVDEPQGEKIAEKIAKRTNALEHEAISWLYSYCKLFNIKPVSIKLDKEVPSFIHMQFTSTNDAQKIREHLPKAGSLMPFVASQLDVYDKKSNSTNVTIQRRIPVHLDQSNLHNDFLFISKNDKDGRPTELYRSLIQDRLLFLSTVIGGPSENASLIELSLEMDDQEAGPLLLSLSEQLLSFVKLFKENTPVTKRYFASFSQIDKANKKGFIEKWIKKLEHFQDKAQLEKISLSKEKESLQKEGKYLETVKAERLDSLKSQEALLNSAISLIKKNVSDFSNGQDPLTSQTMAPIIQTSDEQISLKNSNPFIKSLSLDWLNGSIFLDLYPDLQETKKQEDLDNRALQFVYNQIAYLSRQTEEKIQPTPNGFEIALNDLPETQSFLALRLSNVAKAQTEGVKNTIAENWTPKHPDLTSEVFPIWDYETYQNLPQDQKKLGLIVFAPVTTNNLPPKGIKMNSIYVIAKGVDKILERFDNQNSPSAKQFVEDFRELQNLLQKIGFSGYSGKAFPIATEFKSDFIFEHENYYQNLLKATRENFTVRGTKRYALIEFSNIEQRIITENNIDDQIHDNLLKWRDDYNTAKVSLKDSVKYEIPAPTKNAFWSNLQLSFIKYFRGDNRKIIRWGLDLSGGKTVQIELRDHNSRVVTKETDLRQGINELYSRVNKLGVSEVRIRQEGNGICLDFPGLQSFSASDLVKASSMYFHIINEKFMLNPSITSITHQFLQNVWNEALVTNRKDIDEINAIAWRHLHGESISSDAKALYDNGLRLSLPTETTPVTSNFDDTFSKIAIFRGEDFTNWQGQTHPLVIVFRNFTLEGSSLESVQASYSPSQGNFLSFSVQGSKNNKEGVSCTPRDDLQAWTSQFSKEKITGTPLESYSQGQGWRMAVILNNSIITTPALNSVLRDSASITGSFTQREVYKLEADLQAGSLSFTPKILSEKNVSPELGKQEKSKGIIAVTIALVLAITTIISYYRFGGVIAAAAVICNLLIMWAALQNIGTTLSLAGIAGIILTVAMAVDSNVLIFERIREEFAATKRIASSVQAGYRKAFSAIIDSNITTVIAALILLNFDSGPIRGFALTLIIGIVSSLFTALFMTRVFFNWWFQNPNHKKLTMSNFIKSTNFNFLKLTKPTLIISTIVIVIGMIALGYQKQTILGMDFTGGYALSLELPTSSNTSYRAAVERALIKQGLSSQEFQIRELNPANHIKIFLSQNLEHEGKPFFQLPTSEEKKIYDFEKNPKIVWIVNALQQSDINLSLTTLQNLDKNWTAISGQMSANMRTNAIVGLTLALLCILAYITIRFEFKYAISATLCILHDVVFCIGAIAIMHLLKLPIQIDLHTVAALMTIVGYSLNDTIIIFDRIREDIQQMKKRPLKEIINHSLNVTLSRTLTTSGITLLVLIPLIALGGPTIFGFALVMAMGVIFGTLSSLFVAAPLMQYFHNREIKKNNPSLSTRHE